jgi:hypothetical protein
MKNDLGNPAATGVGQLAAIIKNRLVSRRLRLVLSLGTVMGTAPQPSDPAALRRSSFAGPDPGLDNGCETPARRQ